MSLPPSQSRDVFDARKARLLAGIADDAPDASPKGSIDVHILPLITRLNAHADVVTTSSCSGRISVFLEAAKKLGTDGGPDPEPDHDHVEPAAAVAGADEAAPGETPAPRPNAGVSGKGDGGRWLFVSHDPVDIGGASDAAITDMVMEQNSGGVHPCTNLDLGPAARFVHFKFETMASRPVLPHFAFWGWADAAD